MLWGRILRDTQHGNGLVSCGGKQYEFEIQKHWRSDKIPVLNMIVDVDLNESSELLSLQIVDERALAKEQAEIIAIHLRDGTLKVCKKARSLLGAEVLTSIFVLWVAWVFMNTLTIQLSAHSTTKISFWNLLALWNSSGGLGMEEFQNISNLQYLSNAESGLLGWIACFTLLTPLVGIVWKDSRAYLLYLMPLVLMAFMVINSYWSIHSSIESAGESMTQMGSYFGSRSASYAENMMAKMTNEIFNSIHLALGFYVAVLASIVLAFTGVRKFLIAKAHEGNL